MEDSDLAIFLETGTNTSQKSQTCHDDMIIDREYRMERTEKDSKKLTS